MAAEIEDGLEVVEIAHLRRLAHQQMMADQPGHGFGFGRREPKPRAELERDALAGDRVIFVPALGDIVQQHRDIERAPAGDGREDGGRQRMIVRSLPRSIAARMPTARIRCSSTV